jgi:GABA(A) receptor-associated protein
MSFKNKYSLTHRQRESAKVRDKYPDRIPIIVETDDFVLDKQKFLVPCDLTVSQFLYVLRKRIKLKPEEGVYMFINNILSSGTQLLMSHYQNNCDEDGFLYIYLSKENTFG